jgi:CRP-like cAMP-binding protein
MHLRAPPQRRGRSSTADVGETLGLSFPGPAAPVRVLPSGSWQPAGNGPSDVVLVVEGALMRSVVLRGRAGADLLGPGDLLRLDADDGAFSTRYRALTRCRLALLDDRVRSACTSHPGLLCALTQAALHRADVLATQVVLAQLVAIDDRLRVLLPELADRWGRVTSDGVVLPAFLSHTVLSELVGARRPSLTAAVGRMAAAGEVTRLADRRWLLAPELGQLAA